MSPQTELTVRTNERDMQPALVLKPDANIVSNETYQMSGRVWPNPKTNVATTLVSDIEPTNDQLASFQLTKKEELLLFQPEEWTVDSLWAKLSDIYDDFEANVTNIYQRKDVHLAVDLTFHSVLTLEDIFGNTSKPKPGWLQTLIVGDSSEGKSEIIEGMMHYYGLGEIVDCKNLTFAGIVGGVRQFGNNTQFVVWGALARNDQMICAFEEINGYGFSEILGQLTQTRSSGVAKITKIVTKSTKARCRTIWTGNPKVADRSMDSYAYGIDMIRELVPGPQDVRRFDLALILNKGAVSAEYKNMLPPVYPHTYTKDLCRELILWAWTLKSVTFEDTDIVLRLSQKLTEIFSPQFLLIESGDMRYKLARIAAAFAARTFSHDENYGLYVRECHVQIAFDFLVRIYSDDYFGYKRYSDDVKKANQLYRPDRILRKINEYPSPRAVVQFLLQENSIDQTIIMAACQTSRDDASMFISALYQARAIRRKDSKFYKTGSFTEQLKKWQQNGCLNDDAEPPDYIGERGKF